ncbi:rust resistance kinase Lr10-like [Olea europaea var. sylvestris]|uniref:rust resistance kinase Lr10-like n=1 Tax=Olea europaea var. sylvestris TaxID=158386 RepID=UPI000C1D241E|nr:rust resistance kinase Lr10-like [Olea europaea var. sylvestris]
MGPQLIYLILLSLFVVLGSSVQHECHEEKCRHHGPVVRFPFRLKDRHQQHCGYPGFELLCTQNKDTVLELPSPVKASIKDSNLPFSVQFSIKEIDYKNQLINISKVFGCLPELIRFLNLSASPFQFSDAYSDNFTFFNCSKIKRDNLYYLHPVTCLSSKDYDVYAVYSEFPLYEFDLQSCSKMFDIHQSIAWIVSDSLIPCELEWSRPSCRYCESTGKHCRLKNDSSILHGTECYSSKSEGSVPKLRVAGEVLGPFLAVFLAIASYWIYSSIKLKKEIELKIEQFLVDYKALKPTRYSYADIKRITDNFIEKLGGGGYGTVYKGNQVYFPEWIYNKLEHGEEIAIQIEKEGDNKIVRKLTIVGLWCIQWYPVERPSMKVVIQMLESKETPSMPRNPFTSTNGMQNAATEHGKLFSRDLEIISESE